MRKSLHIPHRSLYSLCTAGTPAAQAALWIMCSPGAELGGVGGEHDLLGTRLIAFRGLRTRTVRIADRLMFWRSREYSTILQQGKERETEKKERKRRFRRIQNFGLSHGFIISPLKSFWKLWRWSLSFFLAFLARVHVWGGHCIQSQQDRSHVASFAGSYLQHSRVLPVFHSSPTAGCVLGGSFS